MEFAWNNGALQQEKRQSQDSGESGGANAMPGFLSV
jgi:hypothetical protein